MWRFFLVESSDGTWRWLPATVVDGVASTLLRAPTAPVGVQWCVLGRRRAQPAADAGELPPRAAGAALRSRYRSNGDATTITAGPVLGELNQLVPDDTVITFTLGRSGASAHRSDRLRLCRGDGLRRELPAGDYTVVAAIGATEASTPVTLPPAEVEPDSVSFFGRLCALGAFVVVVQAVE